jgi:hypothetical protein
MAESGTQTLDATKKDFSSGVAFDSIRESPEAHS